jgi:hypothetical protein
VSDKCSSLIKIQWIIKREIGKSLNQEQAFEAICQMKINYG